MIMNPKLKTLVKEAYKIHFFNPKNQNTGHKPTYKQLAHQISKQYLYIWLCNGKKHVNVMLFFEKQILAFLIVNKNK